VTRFGDWPLNEEWGPVQSWAQIQPGASVNPNTTSTFTVVTYTMPFTGRLVADLKCRCGWVANDSYYHASLANSTPAPSVNPVHARRIGDPPPFGTFGEEPVVAQWNSLSKGTVVTIKCSVTCLLVLVTCEVIGGIVRAVPL
jgi:hypothetical protein